VSEPPVEYAGAPRRGEAVKSLARFWGITERRAADCLDDSGEYQAEMRGHMTTRQRLRYTERRYRRPS
jgi:hypothetical protein